MPEACAKAFAPHHRLVGLHQETGGLADQARGRHDLARVDPDLEAEVVAPRLHGHDHLLERTIACALAQAVDGALDLTCAADLDAGQGIGDRHAQVVVAMHRPDGLVGVGDTLAQGADELAVELGHAIADGVRHVDRRGAFPDDRLDHLAEEVHVRAIAVFGGELDVGHQIACKPHRQLGLLQHLLRRHAQLLLHVQRRGGNEGVDARGRCTAQGLGGARNVAVVGACQRTHGGVLDQAGDGLHRVEVTVGGRGKPGFDDVHAQPLQLPRDAQLLVLGHGGAGRLLAIAQGGVEDDELVSHG